jgi:hypothetical protein
MERSDIRERPCSLFVRSRISLALNAGYEQALNSRLGRPAASTTSFAM